jgi:hypothetical protein
VPNSGRDGLPLGVGETAPGRDPQARQSSGVTCCVRALNARTRVREQVRASVGKARADALERSGPRPRGRSALERGGPRSRGGTEPWSEADSARGGVRASSEADLARGSVYPSSEAGSTRGTFAVLSWRAAGAPRLCLCCVCVLGVQVDLCFCVFSGFKRVSPRLFRGPLGLSRQKLKFS